MNKKALFFIAFMFFMHNNNCWAKPIIATKISIDTTKNKQPTFEANFKTKYNSANFDYIERAEELSFWEKFKHWLAQKISTIFSGSNPQSTISVIEIIIKALAIIIILIAIYFIIKALLRKEGKWIFSRSNTKKAIHHQDIERNLQLVDFENLINKTLKQGNNRLAIRYYYLWLLKKMAQKNIILWHPEKTNADYLLEINNQTIKKDFEYASYLYNNIWYGEFDLNQEMFEIAQENFEKTIKNL